MLAPLSEGLAPQFHIEDGLHYTSRQILTNRDASAHAEMLVIREASSVLGDWRLSESILCVTLEPCTMCSGAIRLSRVGTIVFGAADARLGAVGSLFDICEDPRLGAVPRIIRGVKEKECGQILSDFFAKVRSA
jgi:tRNA(adenine34) deaminase